ncbi:RNA-binding protein 27 [Cichlidogyrus casuarinus]|uniref:RNA-binding protein 27 n=1 Tax=Cichlidogyrus casuarinus TaxID=1844966 RepID=A0ABD2QJG7_9PLAT
MDIDVEFIKNWLNNKLKALSISDPNPLSLYVIALIKKDKPKKELMDSCNEQLQIFLQENTSKFVTELFNVLKSKPSSHKTHQPRLSPHRSRSPDCISKNRSHSSSSNSSRDSSKRRKRSRRQSPHRQSSEKHSSTQGPISTLISPNKQPINCLLGKPPRPSGGFVNSNDYFRSDNIWSEGLYNSERQSHSRRNYSPPRNIIPLIAPKTESSYDPNDPKIVTKDPLEYKPAPVSSNGLEFDSSPALPKCVLVTRLPEEYNDIRKLLDHFSQFGSVVNVQTYFQGSDSKALIEFKLSSDAQSALNSPEPVFSNRFIRVSPWFKRGPQGQRKPDARSRIEKRRFQPQNQVTLESDLAPRSRFRLERDTKNGDGSNQENSDTESVPRSEEPKQLWSSSYKRRLSASNDNAARWEQQKQKALQEYREKAAESEKRKELKRKLSEMRENRIAQIKASLKGVLDQCQELTKEVLDEDEKKRRQKELIVKAKQLQNELESVQREMNLKSELLAPKRQKLIPQMNKVLTNVLDQQVAKERLDKLQKLKERISEIQNQVSAARAKEESIPTEWTKELLELKRQFVSLETISSEDLKNSRTKNVYDARAQTKLDKRPRTLFISGLNDNEIDDFLQRIANSYLHMESHARYQYTGDQKVTDLYPGATLLEVTFRKRDFAETAIRSLKNYRDKLLNMTFSKPVPETQLVALNNKNKLALTSAGIEDIPIEEEFKLDTSADIPVSSICD